MHSDFADIFMVVALVLLNISAVGLWGAFLSEDVSGLFFHLLAVLG